MASFFRSSFVINGFPTASKGFPKDLNGFPKDSIYILARTQSVRWESFFEMERNDLTKTNWRLNFESQKEKVLVVFYGKSVENE